jgi:electron transfer flavoprotein beta subunit
MKIVVCVKQVAVLGDEIELTGDGCDVEPDLLEGTLNEWDAYATEAALRLRDALADETEVVAASVGDDRAEVALRRCLAMGADRAVRIRLDGQERADPFVVAHALAGAIRPESPDLVLTGVQSSDAVQAATGTALAELLGVTRVAVVTAIEPAADGRSATVRRELEGGLTELLEVELPALLTVQTGSDRPRYATLRAIKQAEQRELELVEPAGPVEPAYRVRRMFVPPAPAGAELIAGDAAAVAARIAGIVRGSGS